MAAPGRLALGALALLVAGLACEAQPVAPASVDDRHDFPPALDDAPRPPPTRDEPGDEHAQQAAHPTKPFPRPPLALEFSPPFDGEPLARRWLDNGVMVEDFDYGDGEEAVPGKVLWASVYGRSSNFMPTGMRYIDEGWHLGSTDRARHSRTLALMQSGMLGMRPGGKRRLLIPVDVRVPPSAITNVDDLWITIYAKEITELERFAGLEDFDEPALRRRAFGEGLVAFDHALGEGPSARPGDRVELRFIVRSEEGAALAANHHIPKRMRVDLVEDDKCIPGLQRGLVGAQAGMRRRLVVPPGLGFQTDIDRVKTDQTTVYLLDIRAVHRAEDIRGRARCDTYLLNAIHGSGPTLDRYEPTPTP
ncbi:MAG: FKBP-type peptidyl-prolyl cis-trans isomerase [Nannocystaceae bacterium]